MPAEYATANGIACLTRGIKSYSYIIISSRQRRERASALRDRKYKCAMPSAVAAAVRIKQ